MASPQKIFLATTNQGKMREIQEFLAPFHVEVVAEAYPPVEETGYSFEDNAILKARACAQYSGLPSLADDSGLCVWGIGGQPGVYSKRWVGPEDSYPHAFKKIEEELARNKTRNRLASYICSLAYCLPGGECEVFEGRVDGEIINPPRGNNNFGYDPIFLPEGCKKTFGEMMPQEKHEKSHRYLALQKFAAKILKPFEDA